MRSVVFDSLGVGSQGGGRKLAEQAKNDRQSKMRGRNKAFVQTGATPKGRCSLRAQQQPLSVAARIVPNNNF